MVTVAVDPFEFVSVNVAVTIGFEVPAPEMENGIVSRNWLPVGNEFGLAYHAAKAELSGTVTEAVEPGEPDAPEAIRLTPLAAVKLNTASVTSSVGENPTMAAV